MASDVPKSSESVNSSDLKMKKNLRSAVVTDNDPLKIKLKISKRDITEVAKGKIRNKVTGKASDGYREENANPEMKGNDEESKMKLRSKREAEEVEEQGKLDSEEGSEDRRRKMGLEESSSESSEILERPVKKRGRISKLQIGENEKLEDKCRLKMEARGHRKFDAGKELFCWTCHKDGSVVRCDTCPRVFHLKCVSLSKDPSKDWICPECSLVLHAEKMSTRSEAMKNLSLDQLCTLLKFAIGRMKNVPESQAFWKPVDPLEVPYYDKYITNPMDLNLLDKNIKAKMYGSPQAFLADAKWLLHNSIIFNSTQSPLTSTARFLVKICKQEMAEIENCPDCYLNAHSKKEWFVEVCRKPHILIWARLKGFPFWPAKAMSTNLKTQSVDARFFGAHDKAWVPVKECYLYSKNSPQVITKKRTDLDDAFAEADAYIRKIRQKYGTFCYAPDKTPFIPEMYDKQLLSMIPSYQEEKAQKKKRKKQVAEENGVTEKKVHSGKKLAQHRFKLKLANSEETNKVHEDICLLNVCVSDEMILTEDKISPEDEVARSLEMYDTGGRIVGDTVDENSTELDEDDSGPTPEHGYSRNVDAENNDTPVSNEKNYGDCVKSTQEVSSAIENRESGWNEGIENEVEAGEDSSKVVKQQTPTFTNERVQPEKEPEGDQCVVSSTSMDKEENEMNSPEEKCSPNRAKRKSRESESEDSPRKVIPQDDSPCDESQRKDDDRTFRSLTNFSVDEKQEILAEENLLTNTDELTAVEKQKILNTLGLDASQVDIRQLAPENRQILKAPTKKGHGNASDVKDIKVKREKLEEGLVAESNNRGEAMEVEGEAPPTPAQRCSIKVRDIQKLSKGKDPVNANRTASESVANSEPLKDLTSNRKELKLQMRKKGAEGAKTQHLDPVIKLIKLDVYDKSLQQLNRKLRLSDEVSLLMVDGEKKTNLDGIDASVKKVPIKRLDRPPRARKSMPNRARHREILPSEPTSVIPSTTNISVISVDTENTSAQKNLLKSLRSEDRKVDDENGSKAGKRTVLITTNDKGIKNVDVTSEDGSRKPGDLTTIGGDSPMDGITVNQHKNVTVVANSHLILTNNGTTLLTNQNAANGPTFITNQGNQGNLALTQNNLGQLSLVHLTNLTSGIQTNFVDLTNDTIGLNNSIRTIYTSPNFTAEGVSVSATGNGPLFITSGPANATLSPGGSAISVKATGKTAVEGSKAPRGNGSKVSSGISVRSPASLGLVTSQSSKLPPVTQTGEDNQGEVGSVTAELNRHSIKMAEYMRATIEDILRELSNQGSLEAKYKSLTIEMEKLQWRHQQEIMELKHHSERSLMELRTTLETEKQKCLAELKSQLEARHQKIISETKSKQWCANCGKEALFYCCWNTSYCDYPCQQQHWPSHMNRCAQLGNNVQPSNQLQAQAQSQWSSDPSTPQLPINITIKPQHYFM